MFAQYCITAASITTIALIWRALLLDHPELAKRMQSLPIVGPALYCGFCAALWFTFIGTLIYNPLPQYNIVVSWLTLSAGVLFLRNLIALLIEGTGVLTHLHRSADKQ